MDILKLLTYIYSSNLTPNSDNCFSGTFEGEPVNKQREKVVLGNAITQNRNPLKAFKSILQEIEKS